MMKPPSSIAARAARAFPVPAVLAGLPLFHHDKVIIKNATPRVVDANVKSQHLRRVRVEARGGTLAVACSCTPKAVGVAACKHLWAAFLAIDRAGALESIRGETDALELAPLDADLASEADPPEPKPKPKPKIAKSRASPKVPKRGTTRSTRRHASRA